MAYEKISELPAEAGTPDLNSLIEISAYAAGPVYTSKKYTLDQLKTLVYNPTADNISGGAGGQLLYQSASGVTSKLTNGSSGQYLKSNGGTNAPSWDTPASGISGSGTNGRGTRFTGASSVGDASFSDDGSKLTTGTEFRIGILETWARIVIANITASVTNWSIGAARIYHATSTGGTWNIEGIAPPNGSAHIDGTVITLINTGSNNLTLVNNSGTTTATNRLQMISNANVTWAPRESKSFVYDSGFGGGARWREIS